MGKLRLVPVSLADANAFVERHHRHHGKVVGHKFSLGVKIGPELVGVAIIGRPVSRMRDNGATLEITRLCTDGVKRPTGKTNRHGEPTFHNPCSFLYGASLRAAFALGYERIGTYILASESGVTLSAVGWREVRKTAGGSWSRNSRLRTDKAPTEPKTLFEVAA